MLAIVLNVVAGGGKAVKQWKQIEAFLQEQKIEFRLYKTEFKGHGPALAQQAVRDGAQVVYAMGGDGLLQEVARGLYGTGVTMGVLPAGTGNDFIKAVGIPADPLEAMKYSLTLKSRKCDVGLINGQVFLNIVGTGFDIQTLIWAHKFKFLGSGMISYLLGAICTILTFKPFELEMTFDGEPVSQKATILTVANGQYFGGGMHVSPDAVTTDGWFNVVLIDPVPRIKIPFLLPHFIKGTASKLPFAHCRRCKCVTVKRKGQIMNVDGEFLYSDDVKIEIVPEGLDLLF